MKRPIKNDVPMVVKINSVENSGQLKVALLSDAFANAPLLSGKPINDTTGISTSSQT